MQQVILRKGVLYNKTKMSHPDRSTMQMVLPENFRKQALHELPWWFGSSQEVEQTIDLLRDHFYWPEMLADTAKHIKHCEMSKI